MAASPHRVRSGAWKGATRARRSHGGEHRHRRLRPRAGHGLEALKHYSRRGHRPAHFVSNVDGTTWRRRSTAWIRRDHAVHRRVQDLHHAGDDDQRQIGAGTGWSAKLATRRWRSTSWRCRPTPRRSPPSASIPANMFGSGTGSAGAIRCGRRSGCRSMIAIGPAPVREMLAGAHAMDQHFRTAPFERNSAGAAGAAGHLEHQLPGRRDARGAALRPVPEARSPPICSRGTMESNGKRVTLAGLPASATRPAPVYLGRTRHQRPARLLPAHPPGHPRSFRPTSSRSRGR
jgi:glucose-6-phosphate isomerase